MAPAGVTATRVAPVGVAATVTVTVVMCPGEMRPVVVVVVVIVAVVHRGGPTIGVDASIVFSVPFTTIAVLVAVVSVRSPVEVPVVVGSAVGIVRSPRAATVGASVFPAVSPVAEVPEVMQPGVGPPAASLDAELLLRVALQEILAVVDPAERDRSREGELARLDLNVGVAVERCLSQRHQRSPAQGTLGNLEGKPTLETHHTTLSAKLDSRAVATRVTRATRATPHHRQGRAADVQQPSLRRTSDSLRSIHDASV